MPDQGGAPRRGRPWQESPGPCAADRPGEARPRRQELGWHGVPWRPRAERCCGEGVLGLG